MSFLKRLFGGGAGDGAGQDGSSPAGWTEEYNGYTIRATPFAEGGQHQTCGIVSRTSDGTTREHRFIRADRFASAEEAAQHSLRKGRQLIDEQGERMFDAPG